MFELVVVLAVFVVVFAWLYAQNQQSVDVAGGDAVAAVRADLEASLLRLLFLIFCLFSLFMLLNVALYSDTATTVYSYSNVTLPKVSYLCQNGVLDSATMNCTAPDVTGDFWPEVTYENVTGAQLDNVTVTHGYNSEQVSAVANYSQAFFYVVFAVLAFIMLLFIKRWMDYMAIRKRQKLEEDARL